MTGEEFLAAYPEQPSPARDSLVLESIHDGTLHVDFAQVRSDFRGRHLTLNVTADAIYAEMVDGSRFRPMCSARLLQLAADLTGCVLPTELVSDLIWDQATVRLSPHFFPPGAEMVTKARSVAYNAAVEKERAGRTGLLANVGKLWVLSSRANARHGAATNYGWHGSGSAVNGVKLLDTHHGYRVVQPLATAHDHSHEDYSQVMLLVGGECELDGEVKKTLDVMQDPSINEMISYEQVFPVRQF